MVKLSNPKPTHKPECYPAYKDNIDSGRWEVPMLNFIENILLCFRPCFSRKSAFGWFVTIIVDLMVRSDMLGITSVIRDLALDPAWDISSGQTPGSGKASSLHGSRLSPALRL